MLSTPRGGGDIKKVGVVIWVESLILSKRPDTHRKEVKCLGPFEFTQEIYFYSWGFLFTIIRFCLTIFKFYFAIKPKNVIIFLVWLYRLIVRTSAFQAGNLGAIPSRVTERDIHKIRNSD